MPRAAALFVAASLLTVVAAACSSSAPSRADQGRSIASAAGLRDDVGEVFALALQGASATYTVTYTTKDSAGNEVQLTVTQRPPDRRIDDFRPDGTIESTFRLGSVAYQCTKQPGNDGAWTCGALATDTGGGGSSTDPLSPDTLRAAIANFSQRAADFDFRVEHRSIIGIDARCLVTTRKPTSASSDATGTATLCVAPDGGLLAVEVPTGSFSATAYSTSVDAQSLQLPASPDGPASASGAPSSPSSTSGATASSS